MNRSINKQDTLVEVFKTNVSNPEEAREIVNMLQRKFPVHRFNFALDDGDRILRTVGPSVFTDKIIEAVRELGFYAEVLE